MNIPEDDLHIQAQIQAIQNTHTMAEDQRIQRVNVLRSSKLIGTDSSTKTVLSLTNTMIGSAVIVYPVLFIQDGIIGSTIIMLVVGCIQFITCRLLVIHNRTDQPSFNQSILRIGGPKLNKLNSLINMLLLFFVCIAYYLLVANNFFQITLAIVGQQQPTQKIIFSKYSIQWACIICSGLCLITLGQPNIDPILKLIKYSIYCVIFYAIFIIVNVIRLLAQGQVPFGDIPKFDPDFSSVAGAFALSFLIHPTAAPILKKNVNLKNNQRDLLVGYILTAGVYFFVGFIGGLTCARHQSDPDFDTFSTIFDCFPYKAQQSFQQKFIFVYSKIVQAGILFQNFSVLPILFFLTRKQFLSLVNKPHIQKKLFWGFTIFFLLITTAVGVLAINVSLILSFDGAVVGFFMGYGIPIYIHLRCLFHKYTANQNKDRLKSLQQSTTQQSLMTESQVDEQTKSQILKCNQHLPRNKVKTYAFYGAITVIGIALGVFKVTAFFK